MALVTECILIKMQQKMDWFWYEQIAALQAELSRNGSTAGNRPGEQRTGRSGAAFTAYHKWFMKWKILVKIVDEANAMTVSTIGLDGFPKSRVVLLKKYTQVLFYTNYDSEKESNNG